VCMANQRKLNFYDKPRKSGLYGSCQSQRGVNGDGDGDNNGLVSHNMHLYMLYDAYSITAFSTAQMFSTLYDVSGVRSSFTYQSLV
jgi:hypothetical protein